MRTSPDRRRIGARRRARGAALIEVLVAVAVVALVGSVAVAGLGGGDRARLRAEAAEVARHLTAARMRALETGRAQDILLEDGVLSTGSDDLAFDPVTEVEPETARLRLSPTGRSDGLVLTLDRAGHVAVVELDWLTGGVAVR